MHGLVGYKQSQEHINKRKRFGKDHPNWKGKNISERSGRTRALRMYPVVESCANCGNPKAERHHRDDNTANNKPSNILWLCRKCHMEFDGRIERLLVAAHKAKRERDSFGRFR